ncbi:MAG: GPR endopeptidase [Firmicutes bacterium]|nr:GPR endopeptidase [Bacillota bacterium]
MSAEQTWGAIRTDLAMETHQFLAEKSGSAVPGVESYTEQKGEAKVTRVIIQTPEAGQALGKKPGYYVTIESPALRGRDKDALEEVAQVIATELRTFIRGFNLSDEASALVVGLGNWNATPDALGPKVVEKILVTRHMFATSPPEKRGGLRPVCAVSPGVLGITGIETKEIVAGIVDRVKPSFLLVIDALASRSTERMGSTVQIANTGISPGSGVGNRRLGLSIESLGVPVIAIGVPTVVEARTIIHDALEQIGNLGGFTAETRRREVIDRVLSPYFQDLIVTPKEIDVLINDLSRALAGAINLALHPGVTAEEVFRYLD